MKIATFNANSIRARLAIVQEWLKQHQPDVLCLQETKILDEHFPKEAFLELGYQAAYRGMKSYNGVAVLSRAKPEIVRFGFGDVPPEIPLLRPGGPYHQADESRLCHVIINGIHILNTYIPQGYDVESPQFVYKLHWFKRLKTYFETHFSSTDAVLWCGDMNVAPREMDVHHPERHLKHVCFHEDVRKAYAEAVGWGFRDIFTTLHPEKAQFTFWDYRMRRVGPTTFRSSVELDLGWRIDHMLATEPLFNRCLKIEVDPEPRKAPTASDHTFVWAEFRPQ